MSWLSPADLQVIKVAKNVVEGGLNVIEACVKAGIPRSQAWSVETYAGNITRVLNSGRIAAGSRTAKLLETAVTMKAGAGVGVGGTASASGAGIGIVGVVIGSAVIISAFTLFMYVASKGWGSAATETEQRNQNSWLFGPQKNTERVEPRRYRNYELPQHDPLRARARVRGLPDDYYLRD